ncbi:MAG TPA: SulP family inorganic anion transporter [Gammaproteobacteria bacterium]|nr:SulP family inorganic anion transporter [Gammaproteobacteria bacterium]
MGFSNQKRGPGWAQIFPFLQWLHRVDAKNLRIDLIAGLTGAIIVLPQGVAFATIAGMPPEYGLYAAMVPAVVAALFGSSWHLVSGPTTAASIVLFSSLSALAVPGSEQYVQLALTLTFMVGLLELILGAARLGVLVNFISHSVVTGFTAGAAILIATKQIKNFFGVEIERGLHFHEILLAFSERFDQINPYITAVAVVTLVVGVVFRAFLPRIPYMVAALLGGTFAALALDQAFGGAATGITKVGALPASLPPLSAPDLSLDAIKDLAPVAVAATLLALTEAVSIARSLAARSGQRLDGNQEFIGQGLSNIVGSFFSAYVATGSFNRSGVNYEAGARTPLAAAFAGLFLVGVLLLVAPYAAYLPNAAMAGILFLVAWGLIDFHHIGRVLKTSRSESGILLTTFFATLFLELEFAILLGVMLSLAIYLARTSRPNVLARVPDPKDPKRAFTTDPALPECPQFKIIRIDGSLFFGAVSYVEKKLQEVDALKPEQKHLMVVAKGINFVDLAGAELIAAEAKRRQRLGGGLYLYEVKDKVCEMLRRAGFIGTVGDENIFDSKTQALKTIVTEHLDPEVCRRCKARIFRECEGMPKPADLD